MYQRFSHVYLLRIMLAAAIPMILFSSILVPFRVHGLSMAPTYQHYEINFCWRGAYVLSDPKRFDVVLVQTEDQKSFLLKRIIGLPGEKIEFRNGKTFVNDEFLAEPHIQYDWDWNMEPVIVQPQHIFIVGDNRNVKIYQHSFGEAAISQIFGKTLW